MLGRCMHATFEVAGIKFEVAGMMFEDVGIPMLLAGSSKMMV